MGEETDTIFARTFYDYVCTLKAHTDKLRDELANGDPAALDTFWHKVEASVEDLHTALKQKAAV